jgi:hypothetical protein
MEHPYTAKDSVIDTRVLTILYKRIGTALL